MQKGDWAPKKINNSWYYVFKKGTNQVRIKVNALKSKSTPKIPTKDINSGITKGVMNGTDRDVRSVYITTEKKYSKKYKYSSYTWTFTDITVSGQRSGINVTLKAKINNQFALHFAEKVKIAAVGTPRPANDARRLKKALSFPSYPKSFEPTFKVTVSQPGTAGVRMDKCQYAGNGTLVEKEVPIDKLIKMAFTTGKVAAKVSTVELPVSDVYSLYSQGIELSKDGNGEYASRETVFLSKYNNKKKKDVNCLQYKLKSPVSIKKKKEYSEMTIWLNKTPSGSKAKVPTKISVSFAFNIQK